MIELRPYQQEIEAKVSASQKRRTLVVAPTASGKTVIACKIIERAVEQGKHVLFLAHRRELIRQPIVTLAEFGLNAGVILAGEMADPSQQIQVASIQTLDARYMRRMRQLPPADRVIIDETHHVRARTYQKVITLYPDAIIVGLTATPCRGDGRGLGNVFEEMIECPQVEELIGMGYLVRTKVFAPSTPDLTGVRTKMGDYVETDLDEAVNKPNLVGDIPTQWHRLNPERRKTVVFASSVGHSINIANEFRKTGVKAEHIDGKTPKEDRDDILRRLSNGDVEVVCNFGVLTEGWDQPDVSCIVLARPTKHMGLYRQMIGRVLRPSPGKDHALVLDHAGATFQHGFVEEPVRWTLDADKRAESPVHEARSRNQSTSKLVACKECSAIRTVGQPCPACGHLPKRPGEGVDVVDGDLAHLRRDGRQQAIRYDEEERYRWHAGLLYIARERGYKAGWAAHKFKEKFGSWPAQRYVTPIPPSPEVLSWERSRRIAWAKSQAAQAAHG